MVAVEISEFSPIHNAWEQDIEVVGDEVSTPYYPNHHLFEPTLWTTNIKKYYPHLRRMLKESNGMLVSVTPEEVKELVRIYRVREEIEKIGYKLSDTENASLIGFAGMIKKIILGEIPPNSRIILLFTGKGYHKNFNRMKPDFVFKPSIHNPQKIMNAFLSKEKKP